MAMLALVLALVSACCYAVAAVLQQQAAATTRGDSALSPRLLLRLARQPRWLGGIGATLLGAGLHLTALGFGPLTLVQPLGVSALVIALPLGARLARRATSGREWAGAGVVSAGLAGLTVLAPREVPQPVLDKATTAVLLAVVGIVVAALALAATRCGRPWLASLLLAIGGGVAFGLTSALIRVAIAGFATAPVGLLVLFGAGVAVFAVVGLLLAQTAYRDGGLGGPLATLTLTDPLAASLIGIILLGESFPGAAAGSVLAGLCALTAAAGVIVLARAGASSPAAGDSPTPIPTPTTTPTTPQPLTHDGSAHHHDPAQDDDAAQHHDAAFR